MEEHIPARAGHFDVIVAGAGPAGLGAALAAAQQGARTLLLEAKASMGGVAYAALWMPFNRIQLRNGSRGGVHGQMVARLTSYGSVACRPGKRNMIDGDNLDIHPEYLKLAAFELLEEAGCMYLVHSPVTGVTMEGPDLKGVIANYKGETHTFTADAFVDATGDGDLAFQAGAPMAKGREEDGFLMRISLVFALANVDEERFFSYWEQDNGTQLKRVIAQAEQEGYCTSWYVFDRTTLPRVISVNNGGPLQLGNLDGTRAQHISAAERGGLQVALDFVKIAREKSIPGLEECFLMRTGASAAVRETRRIVGEYVLTEEDAREGKEFPDTIARKYGGFDSNYFHGPMDKGYCNYPYRALLPQQVEHLLVAGRCGSATHLGHAAGKSMGNMMALGQAAGIAAAICAAEGLAPRALDASRVQAQLRTMGVEL